MQRAYHFCAVAYVVLGLALLLGLGLLDLTGTARDSVFYTIVQNTMRMVVWALYAADIGVVFMGWGGIFSQRFAPKGWKMLVLLAGTLSFLLFTLGMLTSAARVL